MKPHLHIVHILSALRTVSVFLLVSCTIALAWISFLKNPSIAQASVSQLASVQRSLDTTATSAPTKHNRATEAVEPTDSISQDLHIANNGFTHMRGVLVTFVSEHLVEVSLLWGHSNFIWTISVDNNTRILSPAGEAISVDLVYPGDRVEISGMLIENTGTPVVHATYVRK
jgi:hypothetical protein